MTAAPIRPARRRRGATPADVPRVAVYCRISSDPKGLGLGVERQRQDCHDLARANEWTIVGTFTDNDASAYSGKPRPQYDALMRAVAAGEVDVIVAWDPDRLHRSPAELERFIAAVEEAGVSVVTVQAGRWDLSTANGRFIARVLGSVARHESEHKSERVCRKLEQNAVAGRSHGRRTYGWSRTHLPDGTVREDIVPAEADVIRSIAAALLRGESLRSVTAALNDEDIPSPTGKPWQKGMVRHLVLRERNAGLRVHRGQVVGDGAWEPILDRGAWTQLVSVMSDPSRKTSTGTAAAHLLSGLGRCGVCGATLRVAQNRGVPSYRCSANGCVIRRKDDLDDLVVQVVVERLTQPDAARLFTTSRTRDRAAALLEANRIQEQIDYADDQFADGRIDARSYERLTTKLRPRLAEVQAQLRVVDSSPLLDGLAGAPDVRDKWDRLPLSRRRAVVDELLEITLHRTRQGARVFDPSAVELRWRTR
jgi:site-specific DNA recombinase